MLTLGDLREATASNDAKLIIKINKKLYPINDYTITEVVCPSGDNAAVILKRGFVCTSKD